MGKEGKMSQTVSSVETVQSYDDGNGFFLLIDVSLVVKLCRVRRCKFLERLLQQTLGEGQVHSVRIVIICLILLPVE